MKDSSRKSKKWSKLKILFLTVAAVILLLFAPYIFSRTMSPFRALSVHSSEVDPTALEEEVRETIRIACYNIAHGRGLANDNWEGGDEKERLERLDEIADMLREIGADIVVLNEVDFDSSWSNGVNQARYIAEHAGYQFWVEERNLDFRFAMRTWRFGNAILSKYPITDASLVQYPGYSFWETVLAGKKRGLVCTIDFNGKPLEVMGVHLSHRSESVRVASAEQIIALARQSKNPMIVAGDFNSTAPGFPRFMADKNGRNTIAAFDESELFHRSPMTPPGEDSMTFRADNPYMTIDWVMVPKEWDFENYKVIDSHLSDHRPIFADIRFQ